MKNIIEGMTTIIMVTIITFVLLTLVVSQSVIIKNRNIFYQKYEEALVKGVPNKYISHEFDINLPFMNGAIKYKFDAYTR